MFSGDKVESVGRNDIFAYSGFHIGTLRFVGPWEEWTFDPRERMWFATRRHTHAATGRDGNPYVVLTGFCGACGR